MKQTRILMSMPITVEVVDGSVTDADINSVFDFFKYIDDKFSTFKEDSEITKINKGLIKPTQYSDDMKTVFSLCDKLKKETNGYFDIVSRDGSYNPSGLVKGWAIYKASQILKEKGFSNFYVDAGGDVQAYGKNSKGEYWKVGIQNPFNLKEVVKTVYLKDCGIATSGTYIRGQHIYNPHKKDKPIEDVVSLTVIGPNVFEADSYATPAFAMGKEGINFIEKKSGLEGYVIDKNGIATMTSGFEKYTI